MNEWMNEWINEWIAMNGWQWMDEWMHAWTDGCMHGWMDGPGDQHLAVKYACPTKHILEDFSVRGGLEDKPKTENSKEPYSLQSPNPKITSTTRNCGNCQFPPTLLWISAWRLERWTISNQTTGLHLTWRSVYTLATRTRQTRSLCSGAQLKLTTLLRAWAVVEIRVPFWVP